MFYGNQYNVDSIYEAYQNITENREDKLWKQTSKTLVIDLTWGFLFDSI